MNINVLILALVVPLVLADDNPCYGYNTTSMERHFHRDTRLARACIAAGDVGGDISSCHDDCLQEFLEVKYEDCFQNLVEAGQTCTKLMDMIFDVLAHNKVSIIGCRGRMQTICGREPGSMTGLFWDIIPPGVFAVIVIGCVCCFALILLAIWCVVNKMDLSTYVYDENQQRSDEEMSVDTSTDKDRENDFGKQPAMNFRP